MLFPEGLEDTLLQKSNPQFAMKNLLSVEQILITKHIEFKACIKCFGIYYLDEL